MLSDCEVVKENVVLWADAKVGSEMVQVFEDIDSVQLCLTLGRLKQPGQH